MLPVQSQPSQILTLSFESCKVSANKVVHTQSSNNNLGSFVTSIYLHRTVTFFTTTTSVSATEVDTLH